MKMNNAEQSIGLHNSNRKSHNEKYSHEHSDSHEDDNYNNDTENKKSPRRTVS